MNDKQLEFKFMEDLLTSKKLLIKYVGEESSYDFDNFFLEELLKIAKKEII